MALVSFLLAILWLFGVGSILALIFGYRARKQIAQRGEDGAGLAMAGIVLGFLGIAMLVAILGIAVAYLGSFSGGV